MAALAAHEDHSMRVNNGQMKLTVVKSVRSGCQEKAIKVSNENGPAVKNGAEYPVITHLKTEIQNNTPYLLPHHNHLVQTK